MTIPNKNQYLPEGNVLSQALKTNLTKNKNNSEISIKLEIHVSIDFSLKIFRHLSKLHDAK